MRMLCEEQCRRKSAEHAKTANIIIFCFDRVRGAASLGNQWVMP